MPLCLAYGDQIMIRDGVQRANGNWFNLDGGYLSRGWYPDLRVRRWRVYVDYARREVAIGSCPPSIECNEKWCVVHNGAKWSKAWPLFLTYVSLFNKEI